MLKTPLSVLDKKRIYYQINSKKINERRKGRAPLEYITKRLRILSNDRVYEKEVMGNLSRKIYPLNSYCESCLKRGAELDSQLCRYYLNNDYDTYKTMCRKCINNKRRHSIINMPF